MTTQTNTSINEALTFVEAVSKELSTLSIARDKAKEAMENFHSSFYMDRCSEYKILQMTIINLSQLKESLNTVEAYTIDKEALFTTYERNFIINLTQSFNPSSGNFGIVNEIIDIEAAKKFYLSICKVFKKTPICRW